MICITLAANHHILNNLFEFKKDFQPLENINFLS